MRLTRKEKDVLISIVNEKIAGGTEDLRDTLGITDGAADKMMETLHKVLDKLAA